LGLRYLRPLALQVGSYLELFQRLAPPVSHLQFFTALIVFVTSASTDSAPATLFVATLTDPRGHALLFTGNRICSKCGIKPMKVSETRATKESYDRQKDDLP
jgi:hypothetical protein